MLTRKQVYVSACKGAKNWHGIRLSVYSSNNPTVHSHVLKRLNVSARLSVECLFVCPHIYLSVFLNACLCESMNVRSSVLLSILVCIYDCFILACVRERLLACIKMPDRLTARPFVCIYTFLCPFLFVCLSISMYIICPYVRPSARLSVCIFCETVCHSNDLVVFLFVRPSVRPNVRLPFRPSVHLNDWTKV